MAPGREITGFHQDAGGEWIAELECGHRQHVRHNPPWTLRPWVISPEGRASHIGGVLLCSECESNSDARERMGT